MKKLWNRYYINRAIDFLLDKALWRSYYDEVVDWNLYWENRSRKADGLRPLTNKPLFYVREVAGVFHYIASGQEAIDRARDDDETMLMNAY